MVDATRALLDELMGRERNVPLTERTNRELTFHSPEVCKYAIAGLCPYGLFRNTKSDLGAPQALARRAGPTASSQRVRHVQTCLPLPPSLPVP